MTDSSIVDSGINVGCDRSKLLVRERLLAQINTLSARRLITLVAPPGHGKTSLLITVAHNLDFPACWYEPDDQDNDFPRFIHRLIEAIACQIPQVKPAMGNICPNTPPDKLAARLSKVLKSNCSTRLLILMDNFERLTNPTVKVFLGKFVKLAGDSCCLLIASQEPVQLPGAGQPAELGEKVLAFNPAELQSLLCQHYQEPITPEMAEQWVLVTDGIIAKLFLLIEVMAENKGKHRHPPPFSATTEDDGMNRHFAELPPAVQHFLLHTSLLEEFNIELCEAVFGPANYPEGQTWYSLTEFVRRHNLAMVSDPTVPPQLRYQPQLQQFLWHKIHQTHPTEAVGFLHRLAEVYAARHQWKRAYAIYQNLGNPADTLSFVEHYGPQLVLQGQGKLLKQWLEAVPPAYWDQHHPWLLALGGITEAVLGQTQRGQYLLAQAVTAFQQLDDRRGEAYTTVWQAEINHILGNYPAALPHAQRAETLATAHSEDFLLKAMVLCAKGQSLLAMRQTESALIYLQQALELGRLRGDQVQIARANLKLGIAFESVGSYQLALDHFELALAYYEKDPDCLDLAKLYYHQGQLYHSSGHYLQAIAALHQALTCTEQSGCVRRKAYILAATGNLYLDLGAHDAANNAFQEANILATRIEDQALLWSLALAQAAVARRQGHHSRAGGFYEQASRMAHSRQIPAELGACAAEAAQLAWATNHLDEARCGFEQALHYFTIAGHTLDRAKTCLNLAQLQLKTKNTPMAAAHLSRVFELTASLESLHPLVITALTATPVLVWAKKSGLHPSAVTNLLTEIEEFTQNLTTVKRSIRTRPLVIPFAPPQLIIHTLGRTQVLRDGHPISQPEWQSQKKAREILFFLLAHPDGKSRDTLADEFWANHLSEKQARGMTQVKYRLNQALGDNVILHDPDLDAYQFNEATDYYYDVQQFEHYLLLAHTSSHKTEQISSLHNALNLYQGSYLPEVEGSWVLAERHRLSQKYLNAGMQLAQLYFDSGHYDTADTLCRHCLKEDPAYEPAHCMIMEINSKQGNRKGIIQQYRLCQEAVCKLASISVSPPTQQLYRSLLVAC
jgi:ATP/maltotriose-dependent transcriptional regulator MalT/DNA-binding SARP family transcriptional activator